MDLLHWYCSHSAYNGSDSNNGPVWDMWCSSSVNNGSVTLILSQTWYGPFRKKWQAIDLSPVIGGEMQLCCFFLLDFVWLDLVSLLMVDDPASFSGFWSRQPFFSSVVEWYLGDNLVFQSGTVFSFSMATGRCSSSLSVMSFSSYKLSSTKSLWPSSSSTNYTVMP